VRRWLAVTSAAAVVVAAAVAAPWAVHRADGAPAPDRTPSLQATGALDGPVPGTPSSPATVTVTATPTSTVPGVSAAATTGPATGARTATGAGPAPTASAGAPAAAATLRDDFTGTALAAGRWGLYDSTDSNGGIKSPQQVRVSGGELQILGQGRNATGKGNRSGGLCWCGTGGDHVFGVWQVRAKFDAGPGYGQDIGLWPQSGDAAAEGHLSIAESDQAAKGSSWHAVIAPGGGSKGAGTPGNFAAWHVYTMEWRATFVRFAIDGTTVFDTRTDAPGLAIPHTAEHLILHVDWASYAP